MKYCQAKPDDTITDFAVKPNDPPIVVAILGTQLIYDTYVDGLGDPAFEGFMKHALKQKNMDRIIDYIVDGNQQLKQLEDSTG